MTTLATQSLPSVIGDPSARPGRMSWRRSLRTRVLRGLNTAFPEWRLRRLVGSAANLPTYTPVTQRLALYDQAVAALAAPGARGHLIEIGAYLGATTVILAEALRRFGPRDGRVSSIDTWNNDAMSEGKWCTFDVFANNIRPWSGLVVPIRQNSAEVDADALPPADLIFIDGDHSYEGIRRDLERFLPRLTPQGRLVLHDHNSKAGVARAVGELLAGRRWVIRDCEGSMLALGPSPFGDSV